MDWTPGDMSSDVEDRRSDSGGGGGFQIGGGGLGIGGVVVLVVISLVTGQELHRQLSEWRRTGAADPASGVLQTGNRWRSRRRRTARRI